MQPVVSKILLLLTLTSSSSGRRHDAVMEDEMAGYIKQAHEEEINLRNTTFTGPAGCGSKLNSPPINNQNRIVGGWESEPHEYPWMVSIEIYAERYGASVEAFFHCGGSLINPNWVLTAGHCFPDPEHQMVFVYLGMHRLPRCRVVQTRQERLRVFGEEPSKDRKPLECQKMMVKRIVRHETYDLNTQHHDIALLELPRPAELSEHVQTVCLSTPSTTFMGATGIVTGWGVDRFRYGSMTDSLMFVKQYVINNNFCIRLYGDRLADGQITENMFCAYNYYKDSCQGDSGGPFIRPTSHATFVQTGIVSFGIGCAYLNTPGVYTSVQHYIQWIKDHTNNAEICFC